MLFCPDDMADLHQSIIHSYTEVVDGQPIAAHDNKVSQCVCVPADFAANAIVDGHCLVGRHSKAIAVGLALSQHLIHLLLVCMYPLAPATPRQISMHMGQIWYVCR